jgi:hypothetical protein
MPGTGCGNYRCCYSVEDDIPACWFYHELVGFPYDPEMDQPNHPECYTGISRDGSETEQTGCRSCGNGCDDFEDAFGNLILDAMWIDGNSYLRTQIDHRFGRDAKNRIFDLETRNPTLIQRRCALEYASCYYNIGGWVCWGHHPCQCTPEPDAVIPCETADPGFPVDGMLKTDSFFNFHGWPPSYGSAPHVGLFCRKYHPSTGMSSPRNVPINVHTQSYNAVFLRHEQGMNYDQLVPCAGYIAPSPCYNEIYGDCTYGGDRIVGDYINPVTTSQGNFDEIRISLSTIDLRQRAKNSDSAQLVREKQLYEDLMHSVMGQTLPDPTQPDGTVTMDRLAMQLPSNTYLGTYERSWAGNEHPSADDLPVFISLPHSYTRWGRVPVSARIVGVEAKAVLYLVVPHFADYQYPLGVPDPHWIRRFAYLEIEIVVGVLCDPVSTNITVNGELVTVQNPTWTPGPGFDGIPHATPYDPAAPPHANNKIIYARELDPDTGLPLPLRVPRKLRWIGRLGTFSDPACEASEYETDEMNCEDLIDVIGTFRVPGLATASESNPFDRNQEYAGGMSFFFSNGA